MVQQGGAIVSEFHSGCRCDRSSFVQRNRIIAGLSEGTLVIESAAKGGSLITAEMADGYERTVMAVPGRIDDDPVAGNEPADPQPESSDGLLGAGYSRLPRLGAGSRRRGRRRETCSAVRIGRFRPGRPIC